MCIRLKPQTNPHMLFHHISAVDMSALSGRTLACHTTVPGSTPVYYSLVTGLRNMSAQDLEEPLHFPSK